MAVMAGLAMAGGIGSSIAASKNAKDAKKEILSKESLATNQRAEAENLFNKRYYQNLTDRADVQNIMRMAAENQAKQADIDAARAGVSGATSDTVIAAQEARNRSMADAYAQIASNGAQMKDAALDSYQQNVLNPYWAQRLGMKDQIAGVYQNISNQWSNTANNLFNTGTKLGTSAIGLFDA